MYKRSWGILLTACLVLAVILFFDFLPILRGGEVFNWQWDYQRVPIEKTFFLSVSVFIYGVGVAYFANRHRAISLVWSMLGACVLAVCVLFLRHDNPLQELFFRTISPVTTGQHLAGARIDWTSTAWHDWARAMTDFRDVSIHVALSPPALPLFYGGLDSLLAHVPVLTDTLQKPLLLAQCANQSFIVLTPAERASAWFGILMPVWASLTVLPLYAIAKRWHSETSARWIASYWAIVPALALFAPTWNTFYPLLALLAFWALLKGIETTHTRWIILSGFIVGLLTFANFSVVPLAGLFGFYVLLSVYLPAIFMPQNTIHTHKNRLIQLAPSVRIGVIFGLGVLLVWGSYALLTQTSPLVLLGVAFDKHLALDRPYVPWIWMHFWEWALFAGIPVIVLWLMNVRQVHNGLPLALLLTMLILLLSNTARGETGRVWLFFAPFVLLSMSSESVAKRRGFFLSIFVAQAILFVALASTWQVIVAPDIRPRPARPQISENALPQNATFGDLFTLVGWQGDIREEGILLSLNWQVNADVPESYFFSALPVTPDGSTPYPATIWQPTSAYLTTCWQQGDRLGDSILIPLPKDAPTGEWYISLAVFADVNNPMQTLSVTLGDGTRDQQVGIGGIRVP